MRFFFLQRFRCCCKYKWQNFNPHSIHIHAHNLADFPIWFRLTMIVKDFREGWMVWVQYDKDYKWNHLYPPVCSTVPNKRMGLQLQLFCSQSNWMLPPLPKVELDTLLIQLRSFHTCFFFALSYLNIYSSSRHCNLSPFSHLVFFCISWIRVFISFQCISPLGNEKRQCTIYRFLSLSFKMLYYYILFTRARGKLDLFQKLQRPMNFQIREVWNRRDRFKFPARSESAEWRRIDSESGQNVRNIGT